MKAIQVRYLPATNTKPARYKVWAKENGAMIVSRHSEQYETPGGDFDTAKLARAYASAAPRYWNQPLVGGTLPNGDDVFVSVDKRP